MLFITFFSFFFHGDLMSFCNSCGRPLVKEDYGTDKEGNLTSEYCKECYQNGEFTEPDLTLNDMVIKCANKMMEKNQRLPEEHTTGLLFSILPGLKRWNKEEEY